MSAVTPSCFLNGHVHTENTGRMFSSQHASRTNVNISSMPEGLQISLYPSILAFRRLAANAESKSTS